MGAGRPERPFSGDDGCFPDEFGTRYPDPQQQKGFLITTIPPARLTRIIHEGL